jgi:hypothetical protein
MPAGWAAGFEKGKRGKGEKGRKTRETVLAFFWFPSSASENLGFCLKAES